MGSTVPSLRECAAGMAAKHFEVRACLRPLAMPAATDEVRC
eukprot:COSAG02_NODE_20357_length_835_cov_1.470109_1_plen_40_part_10